MTLSLLISPEARGAYFNDFLTVAEAELFACTGLRPARRSIGDMDFLDVDKGDPDALSRLSFVQGVFERQGASLVPIETQPNWRLPRDFIFGSKFKGKTNERLTQMLLNVGLAHGQKPAPDCVLVDPFCGRATTLLWAMAYGMRAFGIDEDAGAPPDVERNVKKWAKLTRTKHKLETGFLGKKNKRGEGAFLDFSTAKTRLRMAHGDAVELRPVLGQTKVDLIVSDLPYGVQHRSRGARSPLETLERCAQTWRNHLAEDGVVVLAFNRNMPKRPALEEAFTRQNWTVEPFEAPHRMSESIVRDILIATL